MALTHRRLYKPDRKPARIKGVLYNQAPICLVDATKAEVLTAIAGVCLSSGVIPARGCGYDSIRDEYTIAGYSKSDKKLKDVKVSGYEVGELIKFLRTITAGKLAA